MAEQHLTYRASAWPTIARLSFNITHKMAKLGPKMVPIWLPASQLAPDCNFAPKSKAVAVASKCTLLSPNWLLHHKLCSFSNQTTSTFWQISLDNPKRNLLYPKSCGVGAGRREASGIILKFKAIRIKIQSYKGHKKCRPMQKKILPSTSFSVDCIPVHWMPNELQGSLWERRTLIGTSRDITWNPDFDLYT